MRRDPPRLGPEIDADAALWGLGAVLATLALWLLIGLAVWLFWGPR